MINSWAKNVSNIGVQQGMPSYAIRKRVVFNWSNVITTFIAVYGLLCLFFSNRQGFQLSVLLTSISILLVAAVLWILMYSGRFKHSVNISFLLFPPLFALLSISTNNLLVDVYLLGMCLAAFFLIRKKKNITLTFIYIMACFIAGHLMITAKEYSSYLPQLLVNITAFLVFYITLDAVKSYTTGSGAAIMPATIGHSPVSDPSQDHDLLQHLQDELKRLRQQVDKLSELNRIKTVLFAVLAHDLKDNMYCLNRNLEIAQKAENSADFLKGVLPLLAEESSATVKLLQRLLQWSKTLFHAAPPRPVAMDINPRINEAVKLYTCIANEKDVRFIIKVENGLTAFADTDMIGVVLRNVIANAVKFNARGFPVSIFGERQDDKVHISVIDYGAGISEDELKLLTGEEEYHNMPERSGGNGVGLGLLLCRELLYKNGGAIQIFSNKGLGTKVEISIPAFQKAGTGKLS